MTAFFMLTDQLDNPVQIPSKPLRIISTVPSQTELLFDLGLSEEVIGITKFCVKPEDWFRSKQRIGGTKNLNLALIDELQPNLIIANKEENTQSDIEYLQSKYNVYVSDIFNLQDVLEMINHVGVLCSKQSKADRIIEQIQKGFQTFPNFKQQSVAYLIWRGPYMAAGSDTFIDFMLNQIGLINAFGSSTRYPEITIDQLVQATPNLLLLSSEPYPFKEKHIKELQNQLPNTKIVLVDGEIFSWPGSRLIHASTYFSELYSQLNP